ATPALSNQVDRLGCAADEDDLVGGRCSEELLDLTPCALVGVSSAGRQLMSRPVNVRILVPVKMAQPVDHCGRFLRRRGIVEPHQGASVHALLQDRKVPADGVYVEGRVAGRGPRTARNTGVLEKIEGWHSAVRQLGR